MAYADASDVQARLGRPLDTVEQARVEALLDDVTAEIMVDFAGCLTRLEALADGDWLTGTVAGIVARLLDSPNGNVVSVRLGEASTTYSNPSSAGGLLSAGDRARLRRACGKGGIQSFPVASSSWTADA